MTTFGLRVWSYILIIRKKYVLIPVGGGGTLKFSVYIGEADIFGVKILNFRIFFWVFRKTSYFLG